MDFSDWEHMTQTEIERERRTLEEKKFLSKEDTTPFVPGRLIWSARSQRWVNPVH